MASSTKVAKLLICYVSNKTNVGRSNIFVNYVKLLIFKALRTQMPRIATILVPQGTMKRASVYVISLMPVVKQVEMCLEMHVFENVNQTWLYTREQVIL